jgi:hypothetical protein
VVELRDSEVIAAVELAYLYRVSISERLDQRTQVKLLALEPRPPSRAEAKLLV